MSQAELNKSQDSANTPAPAAAGGTWERYSILISQESDGASGPDNLPHEPVTDLSVILQRAKAEAGYQVAIEYERSTESQKAEATTQQAARRSIALSCNEDEEDVLMSLLRWTYQSGTAQSTHRWLVCTMTVPIEQLAYRLADFVELRPSALPKRFCIQRGPWLLSPRSSCLQAACQTTQRM